MFDFDVQDVHSNESGSLGYSNNKNEQDDFDKGVDFDSLSPDLKDAIAGKKSIDDVINDPVVDSLNFSGVGFEDFDEQIIETKNQIEKIKGVYEGSLKSIESQKNRSFGIIEKILSYFHKSAEPQKGLKEVIDETLSVTVRTYNNAFSVYKKSINALKLRKEALDELRNNYHSSYEKMVKIKADYDTLLQYLEQINNLDVSSFDLKTKTRINSVSRVLSEKERNYKNMLKIYARKLNSLKTFVTSYSEKYERAHTLLEQQRLFLSELQTDLDTLRVEKKIFKYELDGSAVVPDLYESMNNIRRLKEKMDSMIYDLTKVNVDAINSLPLSSEYEKENISRIRKQNEDLSKASSRDWQKEVDEALLGYDPNL